MPSVPLRLRPSGPARLGLIAAALFGLAFASLPPTTATAAAAKPAKKDSSPRIRPKEVRLTASVEPAEARAGETVTYRVSAQLDPGWHIYKYAKVQSDEGPRSTTFDFFDTAGLKVVGDWTASRPPIQKPEPAFNNMVLEYYEDEVDWSIRLQVPAGTAPGKKVLRCQVGYQICDASSCKIPGQWTLPDVVLTVLPGGGTAATAPTATVGPAETSASAPAPKTSETKPDAPATPAAAAPAAKVPAVFPRAAAEPAPAPSGARSEIALKAEQGIIPFLLASALGGLIALAMPCVWPMVPITVNFFVKQGHQSKGQTTGLAVTYCLAIIGIFTAVGVLFSFFLSATALQRLANNPWLNVVVAVLFLAFGLSLLGLFEVRLPSFLLNASAQGESRGGLIGVVFMALTLTITSFTCTFPVVGGLLVMAAGGQFFLPIVGLATFATVLALPFFLLALSPGLLSRMPRERRLDEHGQGRRRSGRDRRGLQVHQHRRDRLRRGPPAGLDERATDADDLGDPGRRLRRLPSRPVPDRSRPRRGQGRPGPAPVRVALPDPGPVPVPGALRTDAAGPALEHPCRALPARLHGAGRAVADARPEHGPRRGRVRGVRGHLLRPRGGAPPAEELPRRRLGDEPRRRASGRRPRTGRS